MKPTAKEVASLRTYIRHLRYALATTTSRETIEALEQMLREAEARLQELAS